jgi:hypothetical protein
MISEIILLMASDKEAIPILVSKVSFYFLIFLGYD